MALTNESGRSKAATCSSVTAGVGVDAGGIAVGALVCVGTAIAVGRTGSASDPHALTRVTKVIKKVVLTKGLNMNFLLEQE